jgi:hypothetical protein
MTQKKKPSEIIINLGSSLQSLKASNLFSNNIIIVALYAPFKITPRA